MTVTLGMPELHSPEYFTAEVSGNTDVQMHDRIPLFESLALGRWLPPTPAQAEPVT